MSKYPELDNKEWLVDRYSTQELSASKIAETIGCANGTVLSALSRHGIKKRGEKAKTKKGDGKEVKICIVCGDEFTSFKSAERKFCSISCSSTYSNKKRGSALNATCQLCGKSFHIRESELKRGGGKYCSEECFHNAQIGRERPLFAEKISVIMKKIWENDEYKKKMSGENNYNWRGGKSFEPYCPKFNEAFKESIREQFERTCFLCPTTEEENGRKLSVHHVNYNKDCLCDDSECGFVPLCMSCHLQTNYNRDYWENLIMDKLDGISWK